jgi:hypothetical protein
LYGRLNPEVVKTSQVTADELSELIEILSILPGIQKEVAYMRTISRQIKESELSPSEKTKDVKETALIGKE